MSNVRRVLMLVSLVLLLAAFPFGPLFPLSPWKPGYELLPLAQPINPWLIEDPLPVRYSEAWLHLKRSTRVPLFAGEKVELVEGFTEGGPDLVVKLA